MLKQLTGFAAVLAAGAAVMVPATPAEAQGWRDGYSRDYRDYRGDRWDRGNRWDRGDRWDRRDARSFRDRDFRRCGRNDGTTGTIVGAIAGGLLGREVVGRYGDRTAGAIVGAGAGALAGRAIDRGGNRGRFC